MQILPHALDIFQFLLKRTDRQNTIKVKLKECRKPVSHASTGQEMFLRQSIQFSMNHILILAFSANHATVLKLGLSKAVIPQNGQKTPKPQHKKRKLKTQQLT